MHLLRFDDELAARAALGDALDDCTPTAVVTVNAVYDDEAIVTPRETLPGFWLLSATGLAGGVAEIGHAGIISTIDDGILGARLEPILAGMAAAPLAMALSAEPDLKPVPLAISDRQLAQQLAIDEVITEDEAVAWAARGDLPKMIKSAVAQLPSDARFSARMHLSSTKTYERGQPLAGVLGEMLGFDGAALDALWIAAADL